MINFKNKKILVTGATGGIGREIVKKFIEIGPGKVLSGLIKRIDRSVELISINDIDDLKKFNLND